MSMSRTALEASGDASPATPTRKSRPRGRRSARKLMEAAASLFLEKGIDATTVDDIVLRAGIAKGTFYHHYESKAALFMALREQVMEDFEARIDTALATCPADDLWRWLDTWIEAVSDSYHAMGPLHEVVFSRDPLRWTVLEEKFMQDLIALLGRGHSLGAWHVDDPHLTATFIFRGLHGVIDDLVLAGKSPQAAVPVLTTLIHHALARPAQ